MEKELLELVSEIEHQEKRFIIMDLDDIKEDEKELIKEYRKNIKKLYTKFSKKQRMAAEDFDPTFFEPSPVDKRTRDFQKAKQSLFDKIMSVKQELANKVLFTFSKNNIKILKKLQANLRELSKMYDHFLFDNVDVVKIDLHQLDKNEFKDLVENKEESKEDNTVIKESNKAIDDIEDNKENSKEEITEIKRKNRVIDDIDFKEEKNNYETEVPEFSIKPEKNIIEVDKETINISFNDKNNEKETNSLGEDFIFNNSEKVIKTPIGEMSRKVEQLEHAFRDVNLDNVTELVYSIIVEYQKALVKYNTEYHVLAREIANTSSTSVIYGLKPVELRFDPTTDEEMDYINGYDNLVSELKVFADEFQKMDLSNPKNINVEWLKWFQSKLRETTNYLERTSQKVI